MNIPMIIPMVAHMDFYDYSYSCSYVVSFSYSYLHSLSYVLVSRISHSRFVFVYMYFVFSPTAHALGFQSLKIKVVYSQLGGKSEMCFALFLWIFLWLLIWISMIIRIRVRKRFRFRVRICIRSRIQFRFLFRSRISHFPFAFSIRSCVFRFFPNNAFFGVPIS